jgi:hypothetical protein
MANFELIFEGCDPSPETIRKLKGVLIADLELDIERARSVLEHPPAMVHSADKREDLERYLKALEAAGAQVLIVDKSGAPPPAEEQKPPAPAPEEKKPPAAAGDVVFEFELSMDDGADIKPPPPPPPPIEEEPVDPSMSGEIDNLLSELGQTEYVVPAREKAQLEIPERLLRARGAVPQPPPAPPVPPAPAVAPPASSAAAPEARPPPQAPADKGAASHANAAAAEAPAPQPAAEAPAPEEEAEEIEEEQPAPAVDPSEKKAKKAKKEKPRRARKRKGPAIRPEFALSIGLSGIILAAVSFLHARGASGSDIRGIESAFEEMAQSAERNAAQSAAKPVPHEEVVVIVGKESDGNFPLGGKFSLIGGKLHGAEITITSPKPNPLTPEQIGRHEIGDPWLYKIEIDQWQFSTGSGGVSTGTSPARLNIDHRGFRQRTVGSASLTAHWDDQNRTLAVEVTVQGGTPPGDSSTPGIKYTGMNSYRIYVKTNATFSAASGADAAASAVPTASSTPPQDSSILPQASSPPPAASAISPTASSSPPLAPAVARPGDP